MRGISFFNRCSIAALGAVLIAGSANAALPFNTGGGMWNSITFNSAGAAGFNPINPTGPDSNFWYNGGYSVGTASTPDTFNTHSGYHGQAGGNNSFNGVYDAPGFNSAQSNWVGSHPYWTGGWAIFYMDITVSELSAASGIFSSDNTSFLFLDGFENTGFSATNTGAVGSGSGNANFHVGNPPGATGANLSSFLQVYHPAVNPSDPAQNSYDFSSNFNLTLTAGSHRLWALVRNDTTFGPPDNPLGFRLQFVSDGGGNTTPVPEPFTMALGAAGIGLAVRRRLKKSS